MSQISVNPGKLSSDPASWLWAWERQQPAAQCPELQPGGPGTSQVSHSSGTLLTCESELKALDGEERKLVKDPGLPLLSQFCNPVNQNSKPLMVKTEETVAKDPGMLEGLSKE